MKNIYRLFIIILLMLPILVNATCNDEELNEWATSVEVTFTKSEKLNVNELGFAYFLSIKPLRDDVIIKVTDGNGDTAEGQRFLKEEEVYDNGDYHTEKVYDFYAVGCYTNLEEEEYVVKVYGGEKSKCKNELLKTIHYTVPRYNRMEKDAMCEKYPEHELCQTYTNKTKDMTEDAFNKEMKKYEKDGDNNVIKDSDLLRELINYALYALIPFIVITIIYFLRKRSIRKKGEDL